MNSEEHPESLAAQAAAWVPPWERRRDPDPEYPPSVAPDPPVAVDPALPADAQTTTDDAVAVDDALPADDMVAADDAGAVDDVPSADDMVAADDVPSADDVVAVDDSAPVQEPITADESVLVADPIAAQGVTSSPDISEMSDEGDAESEASFLQAASSPQADSDPTSLPDISEMSGKEGADLEAEFGSADSDVDLASDLASGLASDLASGLGSELEPAADPVPVPAAVGPAPVGPAVVGEAVTASVPAQPRRPRAGAAAVVESVVRTQEPVLVDDADLAAALESIMLVVDEPVGELQLAQVLEQPVERIARTLEDVSARYTAAGHGIDLRRVAGGWRLYTRPEYAAYVERFVLDGQSVRLTQAALETLAVVAYKQPVTRSRISAIRGVNCDGVMRTLVTRGLIEECGTEPETGAYLYRTTPLFLEKLGLNSVDQLPPLAPFLPDDVEEVLDASG